MRQLPACILGAAAVFALVFADQLNAYWMHVAIIAMYYGILASSWSLLAGYVCSKLSSREPPSLLALPMQQRVRDRAAAEHPAATVEAWLCAGERLTEEHAAAIAFDDASLDGLNE